ncbi:hypothetical protein [Oscillibacter ruminantium]|uniref:hypothetical protein n=1 Tax=Oscillibacter ruminantium TaxID=1263547 RepID=UPI00332C0266
MISPQNLHRILFTSIFMLTPAFLFILQHFLPLVNRIVFNVEHNSRCGTSVEGFALKLLNGVWNTPYPAIPKRIRVFGLVSASCGAETARSPWSLQERKNHGAAAATCSAVNLSPASRLNHRHSTRLAPLSAVFL